MIAHKVEEEGLRKKNNTIEGGRRAGIEHAEDFEGRERKAGVFEEQDENVSTDSEMVTKRKSTIIGTCYYCNDPVHLRYHNKGKRRVPSWIKVGEAVFHRSCYKKWKKKFAKEIGYGSKTLK